MAVLFKNVRARLTAWYVLVFSVILLIYALTFIALSFFNLRRNLDHQLEQDYEIVEELINLLPDGRVNFKEDDDPYFHERWFEVWSPNGNLLYENRPFTGKSLPPLTTLPDGDEGFEFYSLTLPNGVRVRLMSGMANIEGHPLYIRLVRSEDRLWQQMDEFFKLLLFALPLAILIAGLGGYLLARRFLAPVDQMAETARKIGEENLQQRLPVRNPDDELGNLARAFNELLQRLQKSFERLKQFTSDAAHELRTPLTAMRSIGEVGLQNRKTIEEYREIIGSMLEENQRLTHLVDNLLFLSRADAQTLQIRLESFDLAEFIKQTVELILPLAEEKNQTINVQVTALPITADRVLLRQALLNLLDNAIKYSPTKSTIEIGLQTDNTGFVQILVKDQGPGIAPEHLEKIFDRFYRVDKGRSRAMGGSGLGLAIARWAISVQGGHITVQSTLHQGSVFIINLPQNKHKGG